MAASKVPLCIVPHGAFEPNSFTCTDYQQGKYGVLGEEVYATLSKSVTRSEGAALGGFSLIAPFLYFIEEQK